MESIRKLRADEIECKVGSVKDDGGCSLLLYKTARTDMDILDEVFGCANWKCEYTEIKGNLFCTIYIWNDDIKEWIAKQDCGVESAFGDKEKGEASDAFKRAGFKVGIGRELYTAPFIWIKEYDKAKDKFTKFAVSSIDYNEAGDICELTIVRVKDNVVVFKFGSPNKTETKKKIEYSKEIEEIDTIDGLNQYYVQAKNRGASGIELNLITSLCAKRKDELKKDFSETIEEMVDKAKD